MKLALIIGAIVGGIIAYDLARTPIAFDTSPPRSWYRR
jgi:hypothetical protein